MPLFQFSDIYRLLDSDQRFFQISGRVETGGILCIQGPSGSGKSTLLKVLARLLPAGKGTVTLQGRDWFSYTPQEWRLLVHYLPQTPVLFDGTVEENLYMPFALKSLQSRERPSPDLILRMLEKVALSPRILTQPAATLSGGEAARIGLVRAMLIQPALLLLDEPTAHLDQESAVKVMQSIDHWSGEAPRRAVLLISHNPQDLQELKDYTLLTF